MAKGFGNGRPQERDIWDVAQQASVMSDGEIATGVVQNSITKRWQTWVSLYGTDITCFTAHKDRSDADKVARDIAAAWKAGNLAKPEEVTAFLKSLPSDGPVEPLPQKVLVRLSKLIQK